MGMKLYMKKALLLSALLVWCIAMKAQEPSILVSGKANSEECRKWVEEKLSDMTLKEKIGQLFIHTVAPQNTPQNKKNIQNAVKEYKIGGLLFSGGQLVDQVNLTNYAQEMAEVPLLLTFDGEWGLAMRLKGMLEFPRNRVLGCIQDNTLLYE